MAFSAGKAGISIQVPRENCEYMRSMISFVFGFFPTVDCMKHKCHVLVGLCPPQTLKLHMSCHFSVLQSQVTVRISLVINHDDLMWLNSFCSCMSVLASMNS